MPDFKRSLSPRILIKFCQSVNLFVDFRIFIAQIFILSLPSALLPKEWSFCEKRFQNSNSSLHWPTKRMKDKSSIWPEKKIQCYCKAINDWYWSQLWHNSKDYSCKDDAVEISWALEKERIHPSPVSSKSPKLQLIIRKRDLSIVVKMKAN